ncbi:MAG: peptidoglycan-binding protein, partial [Actinomycetota bacterium]|nr:peptidoglycan-binding protein [Actinomycetota bacterium]
GSSGETVRDLQARLAALGFPVAVDGAFGPATADAVRSFQRARGLAADGIAGPETLAALSGDPGRPPPSPPRLLRAGVEGEDVRQTQRRLGDWGWTLVPDGIFGPKTHSAVRGFQEGEGLDVDGIVGPGTWTAMWRPVRPRRTG